MKKIALGTFILAVGSTAAFAHPGTHAMPAVQSLLHLLTEPDHLAMIATVLVAAAALYLTRTSRKA